MINFFLSVIISVTFFVFWRCWLCVLSFSTFLEIRARFPSRTFPGLHVAVVFYNYVAYEVDVSDDA